MSADVTIDAALLDALARFCGEAVAFRTPPVRISGGFWADIYGFELQEPPVGLGGQLVLRVMPDARAGRREIIVQAWLADQGYPVAAVLQAGTANGLGAAFMVMPRVLGRSPLASLRFATAVLGLRRTLRSIPVLLADAASRLHSLDPTSLRAAFDDAEIDAATGGATSFLATVERAAVSEATGFDELSRWFEANRPASNVEVVCHGDLHPFNLLVDEHGDMTVLDWTGATIAPPEMDIGLSAALLRCAPIAVPKLIAPIFARITNHLANAFVEESRRSHSLDDSAIAWWEALQYARALGEVVHGRLTPGSAIGERHPFETAAPMMSRRLRVLTGVDVTLPLRR